MRCLRNSQPYGIGGAIGWASKMIDAQGAEHKKELVKDVEFWKLYQAGFIGFQYFCFKCIAVCPLGEARRGAKG